jgi:NAD(P)-dependent dehydrogenase (short-subunit alcohol dehydrogenase family)
MNSSGNSANRLTERTALVSGAARGIGRAIAELFQSEGATVILLDCDRAVGEALMLELNSRAGLRPTSFVQADLERPEQIRAAAELIGKDYKSLSILVNNAGVELDKSFDAIALGDWDRILAVNLRGAFLLTQAVLPVFCGEGGAVVNISSIHATHAFPNSLAYACSKAGLIALTRNLALELAPRHIRVNAVCPGYIDTGLWEQYLRSAQDPQGLAAHTAALHPLGRRGLPKDVAEAALYLSSDGASFVTGTEVVVDGGLTIKGPH